MLTSMSKHTSQAFTHGTPFVSRFISLCIVLWPPFVLRSELCAREVFDLAPECGERTHGPNDPKPQPAGATRAWANHPMSHFAPLEPTYRPYENCPLCSDQDHRRPRLPVE